MPTTILITGCAGFIGSNFAEQFNRQFPNTTIIGIDDLSTGRAEAVQSFVVFYEGSILDKNLLEKIFSKHKPEFVFHFAALPRVSYSVEQPRHTSEVNIIGTISLLNAAKNHHAKRFIFSSSSSVYGGADELPIKEDCPVNPQSPYALQKYADEHFCRIFSNLYNLDTVALRYFNAFGPGQYGDSPYSTVISAWLEKIYFPNNLKPFVEGDGEQSRDFCYIDNIVSANILAMQSQNNLNGECINIACGDRLSVNEVKRLIEEHTGKKLDLEQQPPRAGDVKHTQADITKAKKLLNYAPIVDFHEGLRRTIQWFKKRTQ